MGHALDNTLQDILIRYHPLKYFTEFWCSDNTDPIERLFIQWGFSQIFPSKAMSAHVTRWNKKTRDVYKRQENHCRGIVR